MREYENRLLLLGLLLTIILAGCSKKVPDEAQNQLDNVQITEEDKQESSDADSDELPPYRYFGDDMIEAAVAEYTLNKDADLYYSEKGSTMIPAPVIIKTETLDDGRVKVYGNFWDFTYVPDGKTLNCISGGEAPGILYLEKSGESYQVTDAEFAGDGSEYAKDIRRFCDGDKELEADYFSTVDGAKDPLKSVRIKSVQDYLKGNGLDQKYDSIKDYGWDPVYL